MNRHFFKILSLALVLVMCAGIYASCGAKLATAPTITKPLVVAYDPFSEKFSPFFADTAYDQDVVGMTQLSLLTTDRAGGIIYNSIKGETVAYNGTDYKYTGISNIEVKQNADTTVYKIELKKGVKFSDGVEMTATTSSSTIMFLDPLMLAHDLSSYDIVGLQNYQTQTTDESMNLQ